MLSENDFNEELEEKVQSWEDKYINYESLKKDNPGDVLKKIIFVDDFKKRPIVKMYFSFGKKTDMSCKYSYYFYTQKKTKQFKNCQIPNHNLNQATSFRPK